MVGAIRPLTGRFPVCDSVFSDGMLPTGAEAAELPLEARELELVAHIHSMTGVAWVRSMRTGDIL